MALSFKNIAPFLVINQNKSSRWFSYFGLGIGVLLLLSSVQLYVNINQLMKERNPKKSNYDFISITKRITDQNMGQDHSFTSAEIQELKSQSFITDATPLLANKFIVSASGGPALPFTTDIFLEAISNDFIDTIPASFKWSEGENVVPIIISSDYLELYNTVFAPSRDLPQISENTVGALMMQLECTGVYGTKVFKGNIVALSDRINSVIVPINFLEWANRNIANLPSGNASRIYIKTTDANNVDFLNYLQSKNYQVNKDKTRFGRVKQVLQAVVSGLGIFAVLVILLAMMLFSFYLQLMIARSKDNLQLLLTLGYSPGWLSKTVAKKWVPVYITIILIALVGTQAFQYFFQQGFLNGRDDLPPFLHWSVMAIAGLLILLCVGINYRLIKKLLIKL
ncbi:MAG: ABC transporter permease [Chitinophagaceae bacterium]|nr:MAG: ABC transporter permease [Chitinophagaceae bacterium]